MAEHVLIAGASGLVGQAAIRHFAARGDCKVTAVSRRAPIDTYGADFIKADLTDEAACSDIFGGMGDVTRLVYAALYEKPGLVAGWLEQDQIETNDRMLRNLFEPLSGAAKGLRHVSVLQGTKAYGAHVRAIDVPAREDRSEYRDHPNFYWLQEAYLRDKAEGASWSWTIFRPQIVFGLAIGAAMNLIPAIGAYGAVLKDRGEPLHFPGGAVSPILEAVDADLLADAIGWAGETDAAANQIFNVTNGDVFVWRNVWPAIADALGTDPGEDRAMRMGEAMPAEAATWDDIRRKHDLAAPGLADFAGESFHYADFTMAYGADRPVPSALVSTIKLREAGFSGVIDTEAMFARFFREFQERKLLPPRS